ncbi:MAG: zf-HC2 domain-containing protein, partial [Peptococcaceae bacterium]|nr:zf-HC2 domain-containing protein [Peptococcaceae bacterium]
MQCREIQELLSPFFDGELHSSEGKAVSNHLAVCPDCRAKWHALCDAVETIKSLPEVNPPPG